LLDDGFQHLRLARDVDIVMLDGSRKLEEEWLLPAGALREPISACNRADLLVVSRRYERPNIEANDSHEYLIFYAQTRLLGFRRLGQKDVRAYLSELESGRYFVFCAIGNPRAFFDDLRRWHVEIAGTRSFRDHHKYSRVDMLELIASAKKAGATAFVTTEKDEQNLRGMIAGELPVYVAAIDFVVSSESEFDFALERLLKERRRANS
jgi:tetraacyldisaccharide 4'-kinase